MTKRSEQSLQWEVALRDSKECHELIFDGVGQSRSTRAKPLDPAGEDYEIEVAHRLSGLAKLYGLDLQGDEHAWRKLALSLAVDLLPIFQTAGEDAGDSMKTGEIYLRQMHVYRETNPTWSKAKIREEIAKRNEDVRLALDAIYPPDRADRELKADSVKTAIKRYRRSANSQYTREEQAVLSASAHFRALLLISARLTKPNIHRLRIQEIKARRRGRPGGQRQPW